MAGMDYVQEVSAPGVFEWDPEGTQSREWTIPNPCAGVGNDAAPDTVFLPVPEPKYRIVAYDFGIQFNILRRLRQEGFAVTVVNARTPAEAH